MTPQEKQLLDSLAARIANTPVPDKDREAEALIQQRLGSNPNALYILTQTVLIQDMALQQAKAQVQDMQQRLARQSEAVPQEEHQHQSFLGKLFGTGGDSRPPAPPVPQQAPPQYYAPAAQPMGSAPPVAPGMGSSFLRSAATTAAGVAAGALAFEGIEALIGHHGGMGMGQGFMGGGLGGFDNAGFPHSGAGETVINNYYDSPRDESSQDDDSSTDDTSSDDSSADDSSQDYDTSADSSDYGDTSGTDV